MNNYASLESMNRVTSYISLILFISIVVALYVWGILGNSFVEQMQYIIGGFIGVAFYNFYKSLINKKETN